MSAPMRALSRPLKSPFAGWQKRIFFHHPCPEESTSKVCPKAVRRCAQAYGATTPQNPAVVDAASAIGRRVLRRRGRGSVYMHGARIRWWRPRGADVGRY